MVSLRINPRLALPKRLCPANAHTHFTCLTIADSFAVCTRKGFLSVFTIHCSLQSASGRMFLHAREQDNPSNMRYMGLTVNKYITDAKQAQSEHWEGATSITPCRPQTSSSKANTSHNARVPELSATGSTCTNAA